MQAAQTGAGHPIGAPRISSPLYAFVRFAAALILRSWFRVHVSGTENLPSEGPAIVAANHKSFLDAFFIGIATPRQVRIMAKAELFHGPPAWVLRRLGAFPVRRGEADAGALTSAVSILRAGGLVIVFPEGTRVDEPDALGSPHHGAGRLALETGAPIVPAAIHGTSHLWLGPVPKPRRIAITFLPPVAVSERPSSDALRDSLDDLIDRRVWPAVQDEYGRLRATPGAVVAALAAVGLGGGLAARLQRRRSSPPRLLGVVEPRRLRRHSARRRRLQRLRALPHRKR